MPIEIQAVREKLLTYRNIGNYRKVIGIITVPHKSGKWQVTVSTEASGERRQSCSLVWRHRWGRLADFSVQSSASWHQLYLGRSEVLLSVYKSRPRGWNMQYPLPEKKASTVPLKLHALIHGTTEVGSHREEEDAWGTLESPRLSGQLGITMLAAGHSSSSLWAWTAQLCLQSTMGEPIYWSRCCVLSWYHKLNLQHDVSAALLLFSLPAPSCLKGDRRYHKGIRFRLF